jgi:alkylated DNA nucleotide flippase Atl1
VTAIEDSGKKTLDLRGTPFQRRVWEALRMIPVGTTVTYSELANSIGARQRDKEVAQVGRALHTIVAQWVHVAQNAVGIPSAQGHLQQPRQRHRKRAGVVEGQNNLAPLAILVR